MPELVTQSAPLAAPSSSRVGAAVHSVAISLPERRVTNAPIAERLGVEEDWIVTRTGVRERRRANDDERLYGFAAEAGAKALEAASVDPAEVDLILVATMSHDRLTPAAAALVAAEIGASRAGTMDVNAACNGFVSALALAVGQVESGRAATVLMIGADLNGGLTDPDDRGTAALFGDGAGAVLVTAAEPPGRVGPIHLGTDGANARLVVAEREEGILRMEGHDTFREAVERLSETTESALAEAGLGIADVDLFVYHQANTRIIKAVGQRLDLPAERVMDCIEEFGNTSAASIPIALKVAADEGRLAEGSRVLVGGFGGGLSWGAGILTWGRGDG